MISEWITAQSFMKTLIGKTKSIRQRGEPEEKTRPCHYCRFRSEWKEPGEGVEGSEIPYVVLEMNSDTVREMRKKG